MRRLRIAMAQINPVMGDGEGNQEKIAAMIAQAQKVQIDLIIFPEMVLCGYPPEDLLLKTHFMEDNQRALEKLLSTTSGITAIVGFAHRENQKTYNAAAILHNQKLIANYHKVELPNYGVFDEKRYFTPGNQPLVITYESIRMAITICEDLWIEGGVVEQWLSSATVDLVVNIAASPFHAGKGDQRYQILSGFARRTHTQVAYVNLIGGQDELVFDGGSMLISPTGKILGSARRFEEDLWLSDLKFADLPGSRRDGNQAGLCLQRLLPLPEDDIYPLMAPRLERLQEIYAALVLGTRDYILKNGFKKVLLGLSGGIDSALTAVIAVTAVGAENVIGVTMPSLYSSPETLADAQKLAEQLKIKLYTVPITSLFQAYQQSFREVLPLAQPGLADENLQARIRGTILMYFSNRFGWLVLTTGNKSENAVGYCTLYGDMAGGFAVIKDVPKTLVYELVAEINRAQTQPLIPQSIIDRPPTAELRPDQKDEDSLPPYPYLDTILKAYIEEDKSPEEIKVNQVDATLVQKVVRMVDQSEYKRRQAPPGVKITPKAFGKDWRLPITNHYLTSKKRKEE